jgi:hypothetical protein
MKYISFVVLSAIVITSSSLKCKKTPAPPPVSNIEQLPPATQEGKNTCGFLVNGKVWVPKGSSGSSANMSWYYDPGLNGGTFNLIGRRYAGDSSSSIFVVAMNRFNKVGQFNLNIDSTKIAEFNYFDLTCSYRWKDTLINHNSNINILKFDTQSRIIAGTFEFSLFKSGCDTIRITQGRFDIKY